MAIRKKLIKSSSLSFDTLRVLVTVVGWLMFMQCQGVQGQGFVLSGVSYGSNETVLMSEIGEENFLVCTTAQTDCCGINASGNIVIADRRGEFYFPNGMKVPRKGDAGNDGLYRARGYQFIGLKRFDSASTISPTGRYRCDIPDVNGVSYNLYINIDYDECAMGSNDCLDSAICNNTLESFTCTCPSGYSGDGRASGTGCPDINECSEGTDSCTDGMLCTNSPGSFVCNDINECEVGTDDCVDGTCVNTDGNFTCSCPSGFSGDGKKNGNGCQVVPPDITFVISSEVDSSLYEKISNQEYAVKFGHKFQLACVPTGQFRGKVTWFMMNSEGNFTTVVEVNQIMDTALNAIGNQSGSHNTSSSTPPRMDSPHSNIIVHDEVAGQLYAYRLTHSAVILGTRDRSIFGADVGIGEMANGRYKCLAESEYSSSDLELSIRVSVPTTEEDASHYLRFSTILFERSAMESLNLASKGFVYAVFESALLKTLTVLSTGRADQEIVDCYSVTRRPIDEENTQDRVECTMDNIPGKTSSELLSLIQEIFVASLPDINREIISQESIAVSQHGFCDYELFVSPDDRGEYEWNETSVSDSPIVLDCAFEPQDPSTGGMARRACISQQKWMHPSNSQLSYDGIECATMSTYELRKLSRLTTINPDQVDAVGAAIANIVSDLNESGEQTADNLDIIANVYEKVDDLIQSGQVNVSEDFTNNTVSVLNGISVWPPDVVHMSSSTLVRSTEAITTNLANQSDFMSLSVIEESVALQAERRNVIDLIRSRVAFSPPIRETLQNVSTNLSMQYATEDNSTINVTRVDISISVPPEAFEKSNGSDVGLVFTSYPTPILFPLSPPTPSMPVSEYDFVVDSAVLGFTIPEIEVKDLNDKVEITLQSLRAQAGMMWSNPLCVSWLFNITKDGQGNWTDRGCELVFMDLDTGEIRCECNHLTNFAVLVSVNPPANSEEVENALKVLSIVGAIISLIGLVITVFTMLFFRKIRKRDASKFHAQLCIAMIGLLLSFLIGVDRTENEIACTFFSCLIQYFTLASVFWMGAEAILMFKKLIIVFGRLSSKFIIAISIICWGVPIIFPIIGLTTLATGENFLVYIQEDSLEEQPSGYCFISDTRVQFGVFLGPLFAILLFNTVIFVLIAGVLIRYTKRKIEKDKELQKNTFRTTIKAMISIGSVMIMFGLSWLFGALTIDKGSIVFQWFFVILNTLQGFFLFMFFCIIGSDAREELKNFFTCNYFVKEQLKTSDSNTSRAPKRFGVLVLSHSTRSETNSSSLGRKVSSSELNGDSKTPLDDKLSRKPVANGIMSGENCLSSQDVEKGKAIMNRISTPPVADSVPTETEPKVESQSVTSEEDENTDSQLPPQVIYKVQRLKSDVLYSWETTKTVSLQRVCQNLNSYNHNLNDAQASQVE